MRVLILGASGMLGHKLSQVFANRFDTFMTLRQADGIVARHAIFDPSRIISNVNAYDFDSITRAVAQANPEVVVNCIGIVKQDVAAKDPLTSISVNALFPHRLSHLCRATDTRLIHISTDCVFSGRKGNYVETDTSDAEDLYGRTKFLGEIAYEGCLTLRTSIIGRELTGSHGLIEWFINQEGKVVQGFKRAIFSGFTTLALAEIMAWIITDCPDLEGIWHVAAEPISKFDLLALVNQVYGLNIHIEPNETFFCDRSLSADRLHTGTGFVSPKWSEMIEQMYRDKTPYKQFRSSDVD